MQESKYVIETVPLLTFAINFVGLLSSPRSEYIATPITTSEIEELKTNVSGDRFQLPGEVKKVCVGTTIC